MSNTLKFGNGQWATKEGSTLAYNDENGNFKPLPFDFTRATSATRVNKDGLIEVVSNNKPRIDYLNDANGALLLEGQRTNKLTNSEDFSSYSISGTISTTPNYGISPSGEMNSTRVVLGSNSALYKFTAHSVNEEYSSIYIKGVSGETIKFGRGTTVNAGEIFTLTGDWQRLEDTSTTGNQFSISTFTGVTARDIEIWGGQVEEGSYATSYIPTQGSTVTRVADICSQTVPDGIIGQTEGTLYCDFTIKNNPTSTRRVVIMSNGTGSERIGISLGDGIMYAFIVDGNNSQCEIIKSSVTLGNYKCAFAYNNNDFAFYVNGLQVGIDTSGTVASCNRIDIGNQLNSSVLEGSMQETKLYNTRLSNAELAQLTTI